VWRRIDSVNARSCASVGEFLDRVAAIAENARVAVDEGDRALAGAGVRVARVHRDVAGLVAELADVDRALALAPDDDGKLDLLVADAELGPQVA
jgi:hypothetical protein